MQTTFFTPAHKQPKHRFFIGSAKKQCQNDSQTFNIESLLCGDGSHEHGIPLDNLVFYASDRVDGGRESYYQIDPDSIVLTTRGSRRGGNWQTRPITERGRNWNQTPVPRVNIPKNKRSNTDYKRRVLRKVALGWLAENPGIALTVGGPGERGDISGVDASFVREAGVVFEKKNDGNCIGAAIINAIDIVRGRETAASLKQYFYEHNPHLVRLRDEPRLLHEFGTRAEMRKIPKALRPIYDANRFSFLANVSEGVYVVHLKQLRIVDHTVVVDANRKLILDSEEQYPMRLSEHLLRRCGGDDANNLTVEDVRFIVDQSPSNPSNH